MVNADGSNEQDGAEAAQVITLLLPGDALRGLWDMARSRGFGNKNTSRASVEELAVRILCRYAREHAPRPNIVIPDLTLDDDPHVRLTNYFLVHAIDTNKLTMSLPRDASFIEDELLSKFDRSIDDLVVRRLEFMTKVTEGEIFVTHNGVGHRIVATFDFDAGGRRTVTLKFDRS